MGVGPPRPRECPTANAAPIPTAPRLRRPASVRILLRCLLNVGTAWLLLTGLLSGQIVVFTSVTTAGHALYGQPPDEGVYAIPGLNDEPYSDRAVACVQNGRTYQPGQLSQLLLQQQQQQRQPALVLDPNHTHGKDAYRVVSRDSFTMDATECSP